jgi:pyruvate/2-oxoacid:ferredoxin oxidoreductase alpha subunit
MSAEGILCDGYMEMRYKLQKAMEESREVILRTNREFADAFGRDHGGMLWEYRTEDADVILSSMGSVAAEAMEAADELRANGIATGVVGIRVFRPFPKEDVIRAFRNAKVIILFEKSISYGYEGGLSSELKAAFYRTGIQAPIHDYVVGLGGRDVKSRELVEAVKSSAEAIRSGIPEKHTSWLNCITE